MIYTSYYAKMRNHYSEFTLVSISTSTPSWFPVGLPKIQELVPGWDLVNGIKSGSIDWSEYTKRYIAKLETLGRDKVLHLIKQYEALGKDVVLLCYEKPGDNCHRHILSEWLGEIEEVVL